MTEQNTAVQTKTHASPIAVLGARFNIEPTKLMEVLRGTVIKPDKNGKQATNEEVAAFIVVANQYGLNPFTREIHAFTSGEKGVVTIVGIDGWTHIVNACGQFDGCEFEEVAGSKGVPDSITCKMYVKGREHPVCATERFAECNRDTIPWQKMPWRMLRHKAYMQAARYAFGLSGIYDEDEARDIVNVTPERAPIAPTREIEATLTPEQEAKPEPVPPPPAEAQPPIPDGAQGVTGVIDAVSAKPGKKKNGEEYTRYGVKIGEAWYATFSDIIGKQAQELKGSQAVLMFTSDGKYNTIVSITGAESEPKEEDDNIPFGREKKSVDREAVLSECLALYEKAKASKVEKVANAVGWKFSEGEDLYALSTDQLVSIASMLKA